MVAAGARITKVQDATTADTDVVHKFMPTDSRRRRWCRKPILMQAKNAERNHGFARVKDAI